MIFLVSMAIFCLIKVEAHIELEKVIGGHESEQGQFPAAVSIQDSILKIHNCGGALISKRHVLSTASCFIGKTNPLYSVIYIGSNDLTYGGSYYTLNSITIHEEYNQFTLINDIALLLTSLEIILGPNAKPIKLPQENLEISAGTQVTAVGWGSNGYPNQGYPNLLNYVSLGIVDNADCQDQIPTTIYHSHICAGGEKGSGVCFGDAGGPLILNDNLLIGLVSFGLPCGAGNPDVYTRVSDYLDWIAKYSRENDSDSRESE